jgi:hypothetical protein
MFITGSNKQFTKNISTETQQSRRASPLQSLMTTITKGLQHFLFVSLAETFRIEAQKNAIEQFCGRKRARVWG